ncbi:hypothetical protein BK011_07840 [Tenericutes bacterium MZ-XQ]|nr:hypothetical protein BK011_07840 [Tenericutes bacterium MZ-XQ]
MTVNQIIKIEFPALSKTIKEYSSNNFIRSYAEQIALVKYPEEKVVLETLLRKLVDWYEKEIEVIIRSEYVRSKEEHIFCFSLLKQVIVLMDEG